MPLDNSGSQSFRTHRLKCKATAGTPGRISNEQTVAESTFVDYKLGKMPYIVQPNDGPAITDAGCCNNNVPADCSACAIMGGLLMSTAVYEAFRQNSIIRGSLPPVPSPYPVGGTVILLSAPSCNQNYIIDYLTLPQQVGTITITPSGYEVNRNCLVVGNTALQDIIVIFDQSVLYPTLDFRTDVTISGSIQPCNERIISTP
jgi:hypothetical protein